MKYAAHFWLRPDGTIGKFPVLTFDGNGVLLEVREREDFKEEAGLVLINGLFAAGIIDVMPQCFSSLIKSEHLKYINNQYKHSTGLLGVPEEIFPFLESTQYPKMKFLRYTNLKMKVGDCEDFDSAFEKMIRRKDGVECLMEYTIGNAQLLEVEDRYGSLTVGKTPGLIALSNIDYSYIRVTGKTKIKKVL